MKFKKFSIWSVILSVKYVYFICMLWNLISYFNIDTILQWVGLCGTWVGLGGTILQGLTLSGPILLGLSHFSTVCLGVPILQGWTWVVLFGKSGLGWFYFVGWTWVNLFYKGWSILQGVPILQRSLLIWKITKIYFSTICKTSRFLLLLLFTINSKILIYHILFFVNFQFIRQSGVIKNQFIHSKDIINNVTYRYNFTTSELCVGSLLSTLL